MKLLISQLFVCFDVPSLTVSCPENKQTKHQTKKTQPNNNQTYHFILMSTAISPHCPGRGAPPQQSLQPSSPSSSTARTNGHYLPFQGRGLRSMKGFFLAQLASRAEESNGLCCKVLLFLGEPNASSSLNCKYFTCRTVQIIQPTSFSGIPCILNLFVHRYSSNAWHKEASLTAVTLGSAQ